MWSLLGLLGIGAYAAGKQIKYNHDMKKRREEVANDPYVERDFVFEAKARLQAEKDVYDLPVAYDVKYLIDTDPDVYHWMVDKMVRDETYQAGKMSYKVYSRHNESFVEKWGDKLKKVRRDWGWDEVTGEPCKPPENWKEIVSNNDNVPKLYKREGPTIYIMKWASKNKMLVMVSKERFCCEELWQLRDGVWTHWGYIASDHFGGLESLCPELNKPLR